MNTCKTCKWWSVDNKSSGKNKCTNPKLTSDSYDSTQYGADDSLIYEYNEGGGFYTGPDFGCVHHEEK